MDIGCHLPTQGPLATRQALVTFARKAGRSFDQLQLSLRLPLRAEAMQGPRRRSSINTAPIRHLACVTWCLTSAVMICRRCWRRLIWWPRGFVQPSRPRNSGLRTEG